MSGLWGELNTFIPWRQQPELDRRMQQRAEARARSLAAWRLAVAPLPDTSHERRPTMNQTIERLTHRLADLKDQHTTIAATTQAAIARARAAEASSYQALLDAIADGRDASTERRAHQEAQDALHDSQLQADVGQVRAQRLQADIEETARQLEQATETRRRRLIAALEQARSDLEAEMAEMTERRFEAEARGLQINARLHQLRGAAGFVVTVPAPFVPPVLRPVTLDNPAPAPVFPEIHRREVLARIGAEVAQIGAEL